MEGGQGRKNAEGKSAKKEANLGQRIECVEGGEGETLETRFRGIFARLTQRGVCALIVRVRQFRFFTLFPPYFWERVGCPKSLDFEPVAKNPLPFPSLSPTLPTTHKQKIFPSPLAPVW